jgi:hypothetical protein
MLTLWWLILAVPAIAFAGGVLFFRDFTFRAVERFESSRVAAVILTIVAWFWTARECNIIGIDVFDMLLKRFPGQLWIMAAVLSYLTIIWMPKNLPVRALMGIFMLLPASLFRTTRLFVPESGFSAVQILVALGYLYAIVGMYGMFYPWRIETAVRILLGRGRGKGEPVPDGERSADK